MTAILIFTVARIPEIWSGYQRSKRGEKPEHTLTDALWWFLIFENAGAASEVCFQLSDR